jgi:hypothetical protein
MFIIPTFVWTEKFLLVVKPYIAKPLLLKLKTKMINIKKTTTKRLLKGFYLLQLRGTVSLYSVCETGITAYDFLEPYEDNVSILLNESFLCVRCVSAVSILGMDIYTFSFLFFLRCMLHCSALAAFCLLVPICVFREHGLLLTLIECA